MMELRDHAVTYAGLGFEVFPVSPTRHKRPLVSQHKATTDQDQAEAWWSEFPDALIGHRVSPDHLLLDVDPRHNGKETWRAIKAEMNGAMPTTRTHYSGRGDGGGHLWYCRPVGDLTIAKLTTWAQERGHGTEVKGRWTAGIDLLRHEHRYTILPPSPHPETGEPYRWAPGRGISTEPAEMPRWLASMLTRDVVVPLTPQHEGPRFAQADSIADWYTTNHSWAEVLEPHGWTLVQGDGDSDGSGWRHPEATSDVSATIRHQTLFVYSTSTGFRPTEPNDPNGYTRFAAYAVLNHAGNLAEAGRSARQLKDPRTGTGIKPRLTPNAPEGGPGSSGTGQRSESSETAIERVTLESSEAFWTLRADLAHIRDFARARMCSPWAVLGVVLARVAAATPCKIVLPPIVGGQASLNIFICLVGQSGEGKDAAISAGTDALDVSAGIEHNVIGLGSGEGILDQFVEYVPPDNKTGDPGHIAQHTDSVLFKNPEIATIQALKGRSGATLMPMLRDAWMGSELGFAYANRERRLKVGAHRYRLGLVLGCQPSSAGVLLDEADVGTPQRFVWLPVQDPQAPDEAPGVPEVPAWRIPTWTAGPDGRLEMGLCDEAVEAVMAARRARLRGTELDETPSGHDLLCQEKVGALLALMDGRFEVTLEDWSLAGMVQTVSAQTRQWLSDSINEAKRRQNRARGHDEAQRKLVVEETVNEDAVLKACHRIEVLLARQSPYVHRALWADAGARHRPHLAEALERLIQTGKVSVEETERSGNVAKMYSLVQK